jgi:hypothetical protein
VFVVVCKKDCSENPFIFLVLRGYEAIEKIKDCNGKPGALALAQNEKNLRDFSLRFSFHSNFPLLLEL